MKMKRIASFLMCCLTLLFYTVLYTKCTNERIEPDPKPILKNGQVSLKILVPKGSISTYADTDASPSENHIDTLYVDLFENNNSTPIKESKFSGNDLKVMAGTNDSVVMVGYEIDNIGTGKFLAKVYANRKNVKIITDEIPIPAGNAATSFFMSGADSVRSNGTSYEGTVHLVRDVAKIRVNISKHSVILPSNLEIDYDNIKIQVNHVPNQTSLFPKADDAVSQSGFGYINYTERGPGALSPLRRSPTFNSTAGGQIDSFYVNENHRTNYSNKDHITAINVTIPTHSPTDGAKTASYSFDLYTATSAYAVLRNYIYTLDIKVRGQSLEPVITIDAQPWNDVNVDGNIYGTYLTVSPEILFDANGEAVVDFCTDAQAIYFNFEDFKTNTGVEIGTDINIEGIDKDNNDRNPDGFKNGHILLDQQHCGSFKFKLDLNFSDFKKFPEFNVSGKICMKAGNIVRCLMFPAQRTYDAHFIVGDSIFGLDDEYTKADVSEDGENNVFPGWLEISTKRLYEASSTSYNGTAVKLYLHLNENLTGHSRTGSVTVTDKNGIEKKLRITQLSAIPVGRFGYTSATPADDSIYNAILYTEQLYEYTTMPPYSSIPTSGFFDNAIYNGRITATGPHPNNLIFEWNKYENHNYLDASFPAINYCAQKNRISNNTNSSSSTVAERNAGIKWYLPAQAQLMGLWLSYNSFKVTSPTPRNDFEHQSGPGDNIYWSSTNNKDYASESQLMNFQFGNVGHYQWVKKYWVRCVRDGAGVASMIATNNNYPVIDFGNGMPVASSTTISKGNGGGNENSANNQTLYKTLRVAVNDLSSSGVKWGIDSCNRYSEGGITGWRLPTQRELQAIWILQNEIRKTYSATFNKLREDDYYWSATESSIAADNVWTVFGSGSRANPGASGNTPNQHKSRLCRIRCVKEE
jgi:hypothetical protein